MRTSHRRRGLARLLYERFESLARERGASTLKAITTPRNDASIAFHDALGMTATLVRDYAGPGEDRVVLERALDARTNGATARPRREAT